jgi:hypothetical protein
VIDPRAGRRGDDRLGVVEALTRHDHSIVTPSERPEAPTALERLRPSIAPGEASEVEELPQYEPTKDGLLYVVVGLIVLVVIVLIVAAIVSSRQNTTADNLSQIANSTDTTTPTTGAMNGMDVPSPKRRHIKH